MFKVSYKLNNLLFEILLILHQSMSINVEFWFFCYHFPGILPFFGLKTAAVALVSSNMTLFWLFKVSYNIINSLVEIYLIPRPQMSKICIFGIFIIILLDFSVFRFKKIHCSPSLLYIDVILIIQIYFQVN